VDKTTEGGHAAEPAGQPALPGEGAELVGETSEGSSLSRRRRVIAATSRAARRSGRAARVVGKATEGGGHAADPAGQAALPGEVAELVGEISEGSSLSRRRRVMAATSRVARRSGRAGRAGWSGVSSGGRWLTSQVLAMAPRLPIRDQHKLRAQFPGLEPEEVADRLILGASRAAASVGAAVGASLLLPLPSAPVEVAFETLATVGIELKLVAELHEVYGMRAPGSAPERMVAYVVAWSHRRGVALVPGGLALAVGSPLRRQLERRLIARAGRSAVSLMPLLTGAAAGAMLNRRETRRLGTEVRGDLRRRSPQGSRWAD
jgi:hypothetical protein